MHDLRTSVYRHLQRLSLAFFTKTRTGEVQSRIANDIGGVDNVLTSTATSIMSTITTVVATVIAMFLLSWQLAVIALALMPIFVLITRKVGGGAAQDRDEAAGVDGRHVLARAGVALGLGDPARQDDGPLRASSPSGSRASRTTSPTSRSARRMTGRWLMQSIQMTFAIMPALIYWFGGFHVHNSGGTASYAVVGTLVSFTTLQTRLFAPIGSLLSISVDVQSSLALFDRIFEYLDLPIDIAPGTRRSRRCAGTSPSRTSGSATPTGPTRSSRSRSSVPGRHDDGDRRRDRRRQDDARLPRLTALRPDEGQGDDRRDRPPRPQLRVARSLGRRRLAGDLPLPRDRPREPSLRQAGRDRRGGRGRGARGPDPQPDLLPSRGLRDGRRRARLPVLGRREAAHRDRPRPCFATPRSSSSTRRPRRSTPRPSGPCRRR